MNLNLELRRAGTAAAAAKEISRSPYNQLEVGWWAAEADLKGISLAAIAANH